MSVLSIPSCEAYGHMLNGATLCLGSDTERKVSEILDNWLQNRFAKIFYLINVSLKVDTVPQGLKTGQLSHWKLKSRLLFF